MLTGQDVTVNFLYLMSDPGAAAQLVAPAGSPGTEEADDVGQVHRRTGLQSEAAQGGRDRGRQAGQDPRGLRDGGEITRTTLLVITV